MVICINNKKVDLKYNKMRKEKEIPFSLNIRKHEKFAQVLELMQSTGKIQFEINKNTVIVK